MALTQTFYDEVGRVWKTQRHEIDATDGSDDDNLEALTWYDEDGQVVMVDGQTLTKTLYDGLGRATHRFTLAKEDDSTYANVMDGVTGEHVLEESQTVYDSGGDVVMRVHISRLHDESTSTTGALDSNADSDDDKITAANVTGRVQITAMWYDANTGEMTKQVEYGTYGGSDFDRGTISEPTASSDTVLMTEYDYNDDGRLETVTDPMDIGHALRVRRRGSEDEGDSQLRRRGTARLRARRGCDRRVRLHGRPDDEADGRP